MRIQITASPKTRPSPFRSPGCANKGLKGLLQAFVFTVLAVLLFKGFWLWLGLGLVLAVVLPLYYMLSEYKAIKGDDDSSDADGDGSDGGGPATVMASH